MRENDTVYYFIGITKLFWMSGNDTVYYFIGITNCYDMDDIFQYWFELNM